MSKPTPNRTPARNNYAMPNTPIASAKRPRSSMDKTGMMNANLGGATPGLPVSPLASGEDMCPQTPEPQSKPSALDHLSPMHPARPKARPEEEEATEIADGSSKLVDVIFSPMLKFLGGEEDETEQTELEESELKPEVEEPPQEEEVVEEELPEEEDAAIVEADEGSSEGSEDDEEEEFNPYAFIKSLPAYEDVKSFCPTERLPAKDETAPPISLVLDLDETLVHCTVEPVEDADLTFPVEFHGMTYQVYVRLRPHLNEFLEAITDKFEVIVFTASQQVYADALLNLIDPGTKKRHPSSDCRKCYFACLVLRPCMVCDVLLYFVFFPLPTRFALFCQNRKQVHQTPNVSRVVSFGRR